jgi:predicted SprT family Zn-dependent metalloprotease
MSDKAVKARMSEALEALTKEFDRINALHFEGKYTRPNIEFSARKSFGGYYQKRTHRIVLSWQAYCEHGWEETINTFRHEIAHIVHLNHSPAFWQLAFQLGVTRKYAQEPIKQRAHRILIYECPACRKRIQRKRKIANSSCSTCDRKYNPKFRLQLVDVKLVGVKAVAPPPTLAAPTAAPARRQPEQPVLFEFDEPASG